MLKLLGIRHGGNAPGPELLELVQKAKGDGWVVALEAVKKPELLGHRVVAADHRIKAFDLLKYQAIPYVEFGSGLLEQLRPDTIATWEGGSWIWSGEKPSWV